MDRVNWGIIGLGNVAFKIAEAIDKTKIAKIGGIASKSEIKLQFFKDKFKLEKQNCFNNYEKLLDNKNIDLVYIALPNSLHYKWMIKCIEKKHNVLVEKPATINFSEMKNYIIRFKLGVAVVPDNMNDHISAIYKLLKWNDSRLLIDTITDNCTWDSQEQKFIDLFS